MAEVCRVCFAAAEAAELEAETGEPGEIPWVNLEPTVDELLEEGIKRLHSRDTWKLWKWPNSDKVFYSPDEFKCAPNACRELCS